MNTKHLFFIFAVFSSPYLFSQNNSYLQERFCKNLHKVFELGIQDNFDSYDGTMVKQSPFLAVPGYSIKLDEFAVTYVDKDNRFVAKTNLNMDSLSALHKLEELKATITPCLDTLQWSNWSAISGDDSATVFFKELKQEKALAKNLDLKLAVVIAAPKVYTLNMYVRRRK